MVPLIPVFVVSGVYRNDSPLSSGPGTATQLVKAWLPSGAAFVAL